MALNMQEQQVQHSPGTFSIDGGNRTVRTPLGVAGEDAAFAALRKTTLETAVVNDQTDGGMRLDETTNRSGNRVMVFAGKTIQTSTNEFNQLDLTGEVVKNPNLGSNTPPTQKKNTFPALSEAATALTEDEVKLYAVLTSEDKVKERINQKYKSIIRSDDIKDSLRTKYNALYDSLNDEVKSRLQIVHKEIVEVTNAAGELTPKDTFGEINNFVHRFFHFLDSDDLFFERSLNLLEKDVLTLNMLHKVMRKIIELEESELANSKEFKAYLSKVFEYCGLINYFHDVYIANKVYKILQEADSEDDYQTPYILIDNEARGQSYLNNFLPSLRKVREA